jgi:four helix bundle protein
MFAHEKLHVYAKAVEFAAKAIVWTGAWNKKHALVDHLSRATESILLNLAQAARQRGISARLQTLDYAIGSSLECAGCLDMARIKELLTIQECQGEKRLLCEITKMLIGLRKGWSHSMGREEAPDYRAATPESVSATLFHHESLAVYLEALGFIEWFVSFPAAKELTHRLFRQIDDAATGVVLNIAEGNGRYAELDHRRFLNIAQSASVKAAVYLDLVGQQGLLGEKDTNRGKEKLWSICAKLTGF